MALRASAGSGSRPCTRPRDRRLRRGDSTMCRPSCRRQWRAPLAAAWRSWAGAAIRGTATRARCSDRHCACHSEQSAVCASRMGLRGEESLLVPCLAWFLALRSAGLQPGIRARNRQSSSRESVAIFQSRRLPMGRGAQTETRCQIDQQLAPQTPMNQQLYRKNEELSNRLASGYQNQLANPGYTPEQQAAIRNQSMGSLASAFGALAQNAANRTARTRNTAG